MRELILDGSWNGAEQMSSVDAPSALLLKHSDQRCCLGVDGKACGIPDDWLLDVAFPTGVEPPDYNDYDQDVYDLMIGWQDGWKEDEEFVGSINDAPVCEEDDLGITIPDAYVDIFQAQTPELVCEKRSWHYLHLRTVEDKVRALNVIFNKHGINLVYRP